MSAFLCSSRHISVIVNSVNTWADLRPAMSSGQCFTLLSHANLVSVNYRYEHNAEALNEFAQEASRHRYDPMAREPAVVVLKAIHCLVYQSCEVPGWDTSKAKGVLDRIAERVMRSLPGYDAAPWGIEDTPHSGAICLTDMLIRREGKPPRHLDAS